MSWISWRTQVDNIKGVGDRNTSAPFPIISERLDMIKKSASQVSPGCFIEYEVFPGLVDEVFVTSVYEDNDSIIHIVTEDGVDMRFFENDEIWIL